MYMPLMVKLSRVLLLALSPEQAILRQKLEALQPFIAIGEQLEVIYQPDRDWAALLLPSQGLRADLVVSCLLDKECNRQLQIFCGEHGILCNVVDQKEYCNTWFMGLAQSENLLLAVSSKGNCPYYTAQLRCELEAQLPQHERIAALLGECRKQLQQQTVRGKALHRTLRTLHHSEAFQAALPQSRPLPQLAQEILQQYHGAS